MICFHNNKINFLLYCWHFSSINKKKDAKCCGENKDHYLNKRFLIINEQKYTQ